MFIFQSKNQLEIFKFLKIKYNMKRSILYILSLLMAVVVNAAEYRMWIDNLEIKAGETKNVDLNMDNAQAVTGFQTDIFLPEGLSIMVDEDDYYYIDLTSRATRGHTIDGSTMPDGAVRVISYTTDLTPFKLNTGAVATITLVAAPDFAGAHTIEVRNTELAAPDGKQFYPVDETCKINGGADPSVTGDVNGDGKVDVADINTIINVILENETAASYDGRADVNGDGKVDVADINAIIDIILGQ